jgi:hypothetical protein
MKYREQRGSLAEAMKTVIDLPATREALAGLLGATEEQIEVRHYAADERIGWDTYLVTVNGCPVGYTDGPLAEEKTVNLFCFASGAMVAMRGGVQLPLAKSWLLILIDYLEKQGVNPRACEITLPGGLRALIYRSSDDSWDWRVGR